MGLKISVCGKGGSGKSTIVGLLAQAGVARGKKMLVVDSDESNSGLYRTLGFPGPPVPLMEMLGGKKSLKAKMGKGGIFELSSISIKNLPEETLLNKDGMMLVSIGKILQAMEGCACPMGVLSREFLKKLELDSDEIAIIDMEAGVEHFGRGVDMNIDRVLLVVEPSYESISIAAKIKELASGMGKPLYAILNKVDSSDIEKRLADKLVQKNIAVAGVIPRDAEIFKAGLDGRPINDGRAVDAAASIMDSLLMEFE